jgi:hypothetical protein
MLCLGTHIQRSGKCLKDWSQSVVAESHAWTSMAANAELERREHQ